MKETNKIFGGNITRDYFDPEDENDDGEFIDFGQHPDLEPDEPYHSPWDDHEVGDDEW